MIHNTYPAFDTDTQLVRYGKQTRDSYCHLFYTLSLTRLVSNLLNKMYFAQNEIAQLREFS